MPETYIDRYRKLKAEVVKLANKLMKNKPSSKRKEIMRKVWHSPVKGGRK
jgi:hypothetical protein